MKRPRFGSKGRKIALIANFFALRPTRGIAELRMHVHRIVMTRKLFARDGKRARATKAGAQREWFTVSKDGPVSYNRAVFDMFLRAEGGNLQIVLAYYSRPIAYCARRLDHRVLNTYFNVVVDDEGCTVAACAQGAKRTETVRVRIHSSDATLDFAHCFHPSRYGSGIPHEKYLAALDVALAHGPVRSHVMVGRSFYSARGATPLDECGVNAVATSRYGSRAPGCS